MTSKLPDAWGPKVCIPKGLKPPAEPEAGGPPHTQPPDLSQPNLIFKERKKYACSYTKPLNSPSRLPWWLSSKESACNAGDVGSIPELGRSPGGGIGPGC